MPRLSEIKKGGVAGGKYTILQPGARNRPLAAIKQLKRHSAPISIFFIIDIIFVGNILRHFGNFPTHPLTHILWRLRPVGSSAPLATAYKPLVAGVAVVALAEPW